MKIEALNPDHPDEPFCPGLGRGARHGFRMISFEDLVEYGTESLGPVMADESQGCDPDVTSLVHIACDP
jgi:hypothetical protein